MANVRKVNPTMKKNIRTFGIHDPDQYWRNRKKDGRTREKPVHHFIRALCNSVTVPGGNVLICGVGDGHEYRLCAKEYETYGVEFSTEAILSYDFPTDRIIQADLNEGIPDFPVKFDAITISMVLHWLDDPKLFLKRAKPFLDKNGALVVIIPNITHYRYRLSYLFGKFPPISLSHKNFQTPLEYEMMFKKAGYWISKRAGSKQAFKSQIWPTLFATDIGYILKPISS
jgi:ubiquinone/menaquinone biosynthesis C-methylase UbiE